MSEQINEAVEADTEVEIQPEITENPVEEVAEETNESVESIEVEKPKEQHNDDLPRGVKKRFDKLTRERYEQQDRIAELERKLAAQESKRNEKGREDYSDDEWIEKVAQDKAEALYRERENEQLQNMKQREYAAQKQQAWENKVHSMNNDIPDFNEVMSRSADIEIPRDVLQTIAESDVGPKIAYHLAKNPNEADKLFDMDQRQRDRFVTRLELKLEDKSFAKKEVTKASPTPKANGRNGTSTNSSNLSIDDWMAKRRSSKSK